MIRRGAGGRRSCEGAQSAELPVRARSGGGLAGNTRGTVCEHSRLRYLDAGCAGYARGPWSGGIVAQQKRPFVERDQLEAICAEY
ncbi:MAG: hypothetical protein J6D54_11505, partial [Olsenella sp.]|nr:hypothetical protein [Olsenella sp.]